MSLSPQEAERLEMVRLAAIRRHEFYDTFRIRPQDSEKDKLRKGTILLDKVLPRCAEDPVFFIKWFGWAADPKGRFGSQHIDPGLSPRGMVPLVLFEKQAQMIEDFQSMVESIESKHQQVTKSRQVALTTILCWCAVWGWMFVRACTGLLLTYDRNYIDSGGKGQRDPTSLFGRVRMFIDSIMWAVPQLKFNQHKAPEATNSRNPKWRKANATIIAKWANNPTGLDDSQDVTMKITRPIWTVLNRRIFADAEGNTLIGDMPDDSAGRSLSATYALMDEIGQYAEALGANKDREAYGSLTSTCKAIWMHGTIPKNGGVGTLMQQNAENREQDDVFRHRWLHWSDLPVYAQGATWHCSNCDHWNPWDEPVGPGKSGTRQKCLRCTKPTMVRWGYGHFSSPWYRQQCSLLNHDREVISRELDCDFGGAMADRFFHTWDASTGVAEYRLTRNMMHIDGFDPGESTKNPAAWVLVSFDVVTHTPWIVAWWMAAHKPPAWWVPFFKRWSPEQMRRQMVIYGRQAGAQWPHVFHYTEDELKMMERAAQFPIGARWGDKYGSHGKHTDSAYYDRLMEYGVTIDWQYTSDREQLCTHGVDWASRLRLDQRIAEVHPLTPTGQKYPNIRQVFATAQPKPHGGQAEYKFDVDKQNPPHVSDPTDAWLYACKELPEVTRLAADLGGNWSIAPEKPAQPVIFGETFDGQF